jgi:hypothetical protein
MGAIMHGRGQGATLLCMTDKCHWGQNSPDINLLLAEGA